MSGDSVVADIESAMRREAERVDAERDRLDRLIARHAARRDRLTRPSAKDFLKAVMDRVTAEMDGCSYEISGPFGLGCEYGVSITSPTSSTHLSFRAAEGPSVRLVDPESDDGSYPAGSVGMVNGLNRRSAPLPPDLSSLVARMEAGLAETRLRRMGAR